MKPLFATLLVAASVLPLAAASHAQAPTASSPTPQPPPAAAAPPTTAPPATEQPVSLEVRDAPVRQVLTQLFDKAKVDYTLDNAVQGFVTLKVTDQPFETVLRLVLRSASTPLTHSRTNGVYEVKPRALLTAAASAPSAPVMDEAALVAPSSGPHLAVLELTYLDPYDLTKLLGVILVPSGSRGGGAGGVGSGGNAGSPPGGSIGSGFGSGTGPTFGGTGSNGTGGRLINGGNNNTSGGNRPGR